MKTTVILFLFFCLSITVFAENQITVFDGGYQKMKLRLSSSILTGITAKSNSLANSVSAIVTDPSLVVNNPAGLARMQQSFATIDFVPGISLSIDNLIEDKLNSGIDSAFEDNESPTINKTYPKTDFTAGQAGWFNSIILGYKTQNKGVFAFAYHKPLYLDMNYVANALQVTVEDSTVKDIGQPSQYVEKTLLPLNIELFNHTKFAIHETNFAYGRQLTDKLNTGFSLNWTYANLTSNLDAKIAGSIRQYGGDTDIYVVFDDPNVLYRNTLNDTMCVNFNNSMFSQKYALDYQYNDHWLFDFVVSTPIDKKMNGSLHLTQYTLGALNLDYDEDGPDNIAGNNDDEEIFDVELLKPSELAYTNRTIYNSDQMQLKLPGTIALSGSYLKNSFKMIFSYEIPLGELSLHYKCTRYRDGIYKDTTGTFINYADTTHLEYTIGVKPKSTFKFACSWEHFAIGLQLYLVDQIAKGVKDSDGYPVEEKKNIIIPNFAIGYGFHLSRNVLCDINLVSIPSPFIRTTLTYNF